MDCLRPKDRRHGTLTEGCSDTPFEGFSKSKRGLRNNGGWMKGGNRRLRMGSDRRRSGSRTCTMRGGGAGHSKKEKEKEV